MKKKLATLVILFSLIPPLLWAQKAPVKFGKIDESLVKMTSHPLDTSADAVVLVDYGVTNFKYSEEDGFYFEFKRITRIKILTKEGLSNADFFVPYYHGNGSKESVFGIKGYTYNFKSGKIVKIKLEKSSIFDEETSRNWDQKKISMPDVTVGSVIELTYTIKSPFIWNLVTWEFQDDIPTVYSEYIATIPEYFDYQLLQSGYHPNIKYEQEQTQGSILITEKTRSGGNGFSAVKTTYENHKIDFKNERYSWIAKDVPAFKTEAYTSSPYDYLSKVKFELRGTHYPNSAYKSYMGTWESLNKSFLDNSDFGDAIQHTGYMKNELEQISTLTNDNEKVASLVNLVRNQIEWDDRYRRYASSTLRKAWTDRKGSTADINLTIVAGLKKLGFTSDPVLISTRGHGMIRDQYAISDQFNSVIAVVELEDKIILLDGTDRYLPVGVIPMKCLNGKGWRVSKTSPGWVQIIPAINEENVFQASFDLNANGRISGEINISEKGYSSYSARKKLSFNGKEKYFETFQNKNPSWIVDEYEYDKGEKSGDPFKSKYSMELNEKTLTTADIIYFNPTLDEVLKESPFKLDKREYPVDFAYPIKKQYLLKFNLPEGFSVEELPKSTAFALPDNAARLTYNISSMNNSIQVVVDLRINKTMFAQTEYQALKQFYDMAVQKCAEQVVLKK